MEMGLLKKDGSKAGDKMNKHDMKRNLPMLTGKLSTFGYDRWWHSFIGVNRETKEKKTFFVEYCIVNPELGGKEPVMGSKQYQRPAYLMVRAGCWGREGIQLKRYYGIEEMDLAGAFLKITAGDCYLSENNIWGRIYGKHKMMWSLRLDKRIAFHVGYSASKPVREINPFDMYWHAEGMRTNYEGTVTLDGVSYEVSPKYGCGYADKRWGRDYTAPWFWLYGSQMKSQRTGEILNKSAFAAGGGSSVIMGLPFRNTPYAEVYYEGENHEINFSALWTFARMKYSCGMREGKILWHMKAMNLTSAMEIKVVCDENEMMQMEYQTPAGEWSPNQMISGGTGKGEILLYRRKGRKLTLVDRIWVKGMGCEYTGKK